MTSSSSLPIQSLTMGPHGNEEFNDEVQMDFLYCDVRDIRIMLLYMTDESTGYTEVFTIKDRETSTIITSIEIG